MSLQNEFKATRQNEFDRVSPEGFTESVEKDCSDPEKSKFLRAYGKTNIALTILFSKLEDVVTEFIIKSAK